MQALRLRDWKSAPVLEELEKPKAGPGEVVIKVGGAGACHTDILVMDELKAGTQPWAPPFTLGHENAGWVSDLGQGVSELEVGQPVAVYGFWGCGRCDRCQIGIETMCEDLSSAPVVGRGGLGVDGGMAEYMLIPAARFLVPLPDGLDPLDAAPLTDAGLTPYHAIRRSLPKLTPDATAVVIGVGGLGHLAVQILEATTAARVVAVDVKDTALKLASDQGADLCLVSGEETAAEIRRATNGRGADVILDFVGADSTLALGVAAARQMGDLTVVGIGGGTFPFSFQSLPYEVSMQTAYWGTRQELIEVLNMAARGLIKSNTVTFPLSGAAMAYQALRDGEIDGRAVVIPNGSSG
ncbi:MAG: alcohol dehydrogenase catalytic domain-containing protein [Chloroflexi bacterium]|nr:alcohol dehydrogenase catalytic domain-containing protein [Chloroflexota bacterium]